MPKPLATLIELTREIADRLAIRWADAECELDFKDAFELLIATVLSAQATDVGVNKATPGLFAAYPDPRSMAAAEPADIEPHIKTIGLYRNKAKMCVGAAKGIMEQFGGEVPHTIEELTTLPGVGRKTANCVLVNAFHLPGIMCDTHNIRVSNRLGIAKTTDAVKLEHHLKTLLPPEEWGDFSHRLIFHGRYLCKARTPDCPTCPLSELCPSNLDENVGDYVNCQNPTSGKQLTRIDRWKYETVRDAILGILDNYPEGLPFKDLPDLVAAELTDAQIERLGSVNWHVTTVKLHLEATKRIRRVPRSRPQRIRR